VRRNIPLIQTTYILLLAGRDHESAQGPLDQKSMANGPHGAQTQGVDVLLCATVLVLEVREADEYQTLPVGEKVGPPQAENVLPACTNPRCERRSAR